MATEESFEDEPQENEKLNTSGNEERIKMETKSNHGSTINNGNQQQRRTTRSQYKYVQEQLRTNRHYQLHALSLLIILFLGITLLVIGIKVLAFYLQSEDVICESAQCLRSSARITASLNRSIDPCTDFYRFACDGWISSRPLPPTRAYHSVSEDVREQIYFDLRHYLDKILPTTPSSDPHFKVKQFYQSCMSLEDIDFSSQNNFLHEMQKAGGWNLISNWHGQSWDQSLSLERLQILYGVSPYFRINVGVDDLNPTLPFIIKIYPSGLGLPSKDYYFNPAYKNIVDAYKQYMSETVIIFGGTKLNSNQFAENTFNYEKRIAEVTPDFEDYLLPTNVFKRRFSIRELKILAPSIKWSNILQNYFVKARLNDNTRVLLAFESYFRNISNIISTTDTKGLNDYLMWKMISTYAPYLSNEFRIIHNNFEQALNGLPSTNSLNDDDRWRFCLDTTNKFLGYSLASLYVQNKAKHIRNSTQSAKSEIVDSIRSVIGNNHQMFVWSAQAGSRNFLRTKLANLEVFMGQPNFVLKPNLADYYNEYIVGVKFLQNLIEAVGHRHKKMEMLLSESRRPDFAWQVLPTDVRLVYDYSANHLYVPAGVLQPPLYSSTESPVLQFAGLGFQVASHMLQAFDLTGLHYNHDGLLKPSTDQHYADDLDLKHGLNCLHTILASQHIEANRTLSQTYVDLGALKFAWMAYKEHETRSGTTGAYRLPSLHYTNDQLFFLSFAQSFCSGVQQQSERIYFEQRNRLPDSIRVNTLLSQSRTFAQVFQCEPKPAYSEACGLWN